MPQGHPRPGASPCSETSDAVRHRPLIAHPAVAASNPLDATHSHPASTRDTTPTPPAGEAGRGGNPFIAYPYGTAPALPIDLSGLTAADASALQVIAQAAAETLVNRYNNECCFARQAGSAGGRLTHERAATKAAEALHRAKHLEAAALRQERAAGRTEAYARRAAMETGR